MKHDLPSSGAAPIILALRQVADTLQKQDLSREDAIREARQHLATVLMLHRKVPRPVDPDSLAARLCQAMLAQGLRQVDMARVCQVSTASVCEWMNGGVKSMEGKSLVRAAIALHVNPLWLAEGEGPMRADAPAAPRKPSRAQPKGA